MGLELGEEYVALSRGGRAVHAGVLLVDDGGEPLELVPHRRHHGLQPVALALRPRGSLFDRREVLRSLEPARLRARRRVAKHLLGLAELLAKPGDLHGHGAVDAGPADGFTLVDEKRLAQRLDLVRQFPFTRHAGVNLGVRGVQLALDVPDRVRVLLHRRLRVHARALRVGQPRLGLVERLAKFLVLRLDASRRLLGLAQTRRGRRRDGSLPRVCLDLGERVRERLAQRVRPPFGILRVARQFTVGSPSLFQVLVGDHQHRARLRELVPQARLLLLELHTHVPERLHRRGEPHFHVRGRRVLLGSSVHHRRGPARVSSGDKRDVVFAERHPPRSLRRGRGLGR